jgi:hypothetical protein
MQRKVARPYRFHIDACLGGKQLVRACESLLEANEQVRAHHTVYADGTGDIDWLGECAADGWVILTSDAAILRRTEEIACVRLAAGVLVVFGQKLTAQMVINMMPRVLPAVRGHLQAANAPFVIQVHSIASIKRKKL